MQKQSWHSTYDNDMEPEARGNGKRRVIPEEQLKAMAMADRSGGTIVCEVCKTRYGASHVKPTTVRFVEHMVCTFCLKKYRH